MNGWIGVFTVGMLLSGSINTILTKYQDSVVVGTTAEGAPQVFLHPLLQTGMMFAGEALCLVAYLIYWHLKKILTQDRFRPPPLLASASMLRLDAARPVAPGRWKRRLQRYLVFAIPMLCDVTATTTLNVGLYLTYTSTFQMLRGTLVLYTGMMTVVLLKRFPKPFQWTGMSCIALGAFVVGLAAVVSGGGGSNASAAPNPLLGNLLCIVAQFGTATQIVIEEKFMRRFRCHPVLAVGLEGMWGLLLLFFLAPIVGRVQWPGGGGPVDDIAAGLKQMATIPSLRYTSIYMVIGVAVFNACGMQVTHHVSGAARSTIDATRTLIVWSASLALGWETFKALTVPGFLLLLFGTSLYNEVVRLPGLFKYDSDSKPEPAVGAAVVGGRGGDADSPQDPLLLRDETDEEEEDEVVDVEDGPTRPLLGARGSRGRLAQLRAEEDSIGMREVST